MRTPDAECVALLRQAARPLRGDASDHDVLLQKVGHKSLVLIGQATNGTHEFYLQRARITQRLIAEKGFHAVAIEGDWADAALVNRHVRGNLGPACGAPLEPPAALARFQHFPAWMWRNTVVAGFIDWLREFNSVRPLGARTGFYGLDLCGLHGTAAAVLAHLQRSDPAFARDLRGHCAGADVFAPDPGALALMAVLASVAPAQEAVQEALAQCLARGREVAERSAARHDDESRFDAAQHARLQRCAQAHVRAMVVGAPCLGALRGQHMAESVASLQAHLRRRVARPKIVVWVHNAHAGDARATEQGRLRAETSLGQRLRQPAPQDCLLVGMTTHAGSVMAAREWGGSAQQMPLRPAAPGSLEHLLHETGLGRFWLPLGGRSEACEVLRQPRLQRAIGAVYHPEAEREHHGFFSRTSEQFDALLHLDETRAVTPLAAEAAWGVGAAASRRTATAHDGPATASGGR